MTPDQFAQWALSQGQVAKPDGSYLGECVSLIAQYCNRVLGFTPGAWGDAWQWGQSSNSNVQAHFNLVAGLSPHDIVVYPQNWAGSAPGHIGLFWGNGQILEQNGHVSRRVSLSSLANGYYAILRPKGVNMPTIATKDIVDSLAHAYLNDSLAANPGLQFYVGQPVENVITAFNTADERAAYLKHIQDLEAGVDRASVIQYINSNLK